MNMAWIKTVYLYLVSLISLVILVIAGIMLINLGLKTWVFTKADDNIYYYQEVSPCTSIMQEAGSEPHVDPACEPGYAEKQKQEELDRRKDQKQSDAAQALAMIIVAAPVFFYHWKLTRKEA